MFYHHEVKKPQNKQTKKNTKKQTKGTKKPLENKQTNNNKKPPKNGTLWEYTLHYEILHFQTFWFAEEWPILPDETLQNVTFKDLAALTCTAYYVDYIYDVALRFLLSCCISSFCSLALESWTDIQEAETIRLSTNQLNISIVLVTSHIFCTFIPKASTCWWN